MMTLLRAFCIEAKAELDIWEAHAFYQANKNKYSSLNFKCSKCGVRIDAVNYKKEQGAYKVTLHYKRNHNDPHKSYCDWGIQEEVAEIVEECLEERRPNGVKLKDVVEVFDPTDCEHDDETILASVERVIASGLDGGSDRKRRIGNMVDEVRSSQHRTSLLGKLVTHYYAIPAWEECKTVYVEVRGHRRSYDQIFKPIKWFNPYSKDRVFYGNAGIELSENEYKIKFKHQIDSKIEDRENKKTYENVGVVLILNKELFAQNKRSAPHIKKCISECQSSGKSTYIYFYYSCDSDKYEICQNGESINILIYPNSINHIDTREKVPIRR